MKKFPPEKMSFEEFLTKYRRVVGMVFLVGLIEAYNLSFMAYIEWLQDDAHHYVIGDDFTFGSDGFCSL